MDVVINGTKELSWITLIMTCIENKNMPIDPTEASVIKNKITLLLDHTYVILETSDTRGGG